MGAIGPGDWVECVRLSAAAQRVLPVRVGGVYCVDAVVDTGSKCQNCERCDGVGLRLRGVAFKVDGFRAGLICAACFRPIYRPKSDLIEQLKQPAPDAVRETVFAE